MTRRQLARHHSHPVYVSFLQTSLPIALTLIAASLTGCVWNSDLYDTYVGNKDYISSCDSYCTGNFDVAILNKAQCTNKGGKWFALSKEKCINTTTHSVVRCSDDNGVAIKEECIFSKDSCEKAQYQWIETDYQVFDLSNGKYARYIGNTKEPKDVYEINNYQCGTLYEIFNCNSPETNKNCEGYDSNNSNCSAEDKTIINEHMMDSINLGLCPHDFGFCTSYTPEETTHNINNTLPDIYNISICSLCPKNTFSYRIANQENNSYSIKCLPFADYENDKDNCGCGFPDIKCDNNQLCSNYACTSCAADREKQNDDCCSDNFSININKETYCYELNTIISEVQPKTVNSSICQNDILPFNSDLNFSCCDNKVKLYYSWNGSDCPGEMGYTENKFSACLDASNVESHNNPCWCIVDSTPISSDNPTPNCCEGREKYEYIPSERCKDHDNDSITVACLTADELPQNESEGCWKKFCVASTAPQDEIEKKGCCPEHMLYTYSKGGECSEDYTSGCFTQDEYEGLNKNCWIEGGAG